ncbi:MAG: hypothetical protein PHI03_09130 [Bacteroidales bacterium]|nr:hypothetical protein [Bacteroidales bacterium]
MEIKQKLLQLASEYLLILIQPLTNYYATKPIPIKANFAFSIAWHSQKRYIRLSHSLSRTEGAVAVTTIITHKTI